MDRDFNIAAVLVIAFGWSVAVLGFIATAWMFADLQDVDLVAIQRWQLILPGLTAMGVGAAAAGIGHLLAKP